VSVMLKAVPLSPTRGERQDRIEPIQGPWQRCYLAYHSPMAVLEKIRYGVAWGGKAMADHLIGAVVAAISFTGFIAWVTGLGTLIRNEWTCVLSAQCTVVGWTVGVGIYACSPSDGGRICTRHWRTRMPPTSRICRTRW
jgi:hypothetical protein